MPTLSDDGPKTRYGWSKPERIEYFSRGNDGTNTHYRLSFQGRDIDRPVLQIPLDLPKYRLMNGRTAALQDEYLSTKNVPEDYFRSDPERIEAQEVQHALLKGLISEEGLDDHFRNVQNRQIDPLILDSEGFVLNGNRRLCTFRELVWTDPEKYSHFDYLRAVVLPHADERALDRLEADLQLTPALRADYSWYARAQMIIDRQRYHNLTIEELASFYQMRKSEVEELLEMHRYAAAYLKSRGKDGQWSQLGGKNQYAFIQLAKGARGLPGEDALLFQRLAFQFIDDPTGGRLYEQIPKIREHLPRVKQQLAAEFAVEPSLEGDQVAESFDPLAPEPDAELATGYALAQTVDTESNRNTTLEITRDVIQAEEDLKKELNQSNLLVKKLRKAHTELSSAVTSGLRPEANFDGVSQQLDHIEQKVTQIREFIDQRAVPKS